MLYFTTDILMILSVCLILNKQMVFLNFSILNILILNSRLKNRKMANQHSSTYLLCKLPKSFVSVFTITSICLYTNFVSFTRHSYKIRLINTLTYLTYGTSSSWTSFNEKNSNGKHLLMKNIYPSYLIDKQVKLFLHNKFSTNNCNAVKEIKTTFYYKLPCIGSFSINTKNCNINIFFLLLKQAICFWKKMIYLGLSRIKKRASKYHHFGVWKYCTLNLLQCFYYFCLM